MEDKTILITGANDGIGRATAERLAEYGAHLVLACRDEVKAQHTAQAITKKTGNHRIDTLPLDLSDFSSIRAAADEFLAEHPKLDVLINNAGVYTDKLELTKEGYELQFGVNYLGHFLLTMALMPAIRCCRHCSRVINVSSAQHVKGGLDFGSLRGEKGSKDYNGSKAYAQSKLANVLFTMELDRRFGEELTTNCLHPGVVGTRLANKKAGTLTRTVWSMYKPFATPPHEGADTSVYLAQSPEVQDVSGRYFDENQCLRKPSSIARNEHLARRLWEFSEKAVSDYLPREQY
ncbi:SDR family oxidoreductase [Neolewinella aurantiaca]|uniref:SDR family oxidoreductase n=1 Tax=Neolewinella aurantiaca TaxID=2602767 RepID=A0A5C7FHB9_9BACT|nr:SDR family oxidoreductase [Neolewinella aurantiaca]TXF90586.1 SDR family oxidoreductase [Neolewinella aurantiaca]